MNDRGKAGFQLLRGPSAYQLEVWGDRVANMSFLVVPIAVCAWVVWGSTDPLIPVVSGVTVATGIVAITLANLRIGPSGWVSWAEARRGYTTLPGPNYLDRPLINFRTREVLRPPGGPETSYAEYKRLTRR